VLVRSGVTPAVAGRAGRRREAEPQAGLRQGGSPL